MRRATLRGLTLLLSLICFQLAVSAQESTARAQEEVARNQEIAARNQEAAARLAEEAAKDNPDAAARTQEAALRAQAAANRAQEAANRAQEAVNNDPNSSATQAVASRAQEAANRAQEIANRAQEAANRVTKMRPAVSALSATPTVVVGAAASDSTENGTPPTPLATSTTVATTETPVVATGGGDAPSGGAPRGGAAQNAIQDYNEFLNERFDNVVRARLGPKNNSNQNETPSISANSSSLVEKSSVSDLLSFALTPSATTGGGSGDKPTSSSVTIPAYAFKAFASGRDPLDPSFYSANRNWRKLSFTYGHDYTRENEGDPLVKGNIYGIKFLPYDKRDVSDPANQPDVRKIAELFHESGPGAARTSARIKRELFNTLSERGRLPAGVTGADDTARLDSFISYLAGTDAQGRDIPGKDVVQELADALGGKDVLIKLVDDIVERNIDPEVKFAEEEQKAFDRIRRRPQVAFVFLTKQRPSTRPDEYMGGLTMDLGVLQRWNLTFNGTFNYTDHKTKESSRGGTFATELQIPLNVVNQLSDRVPWTFSFGASGNWMTKKGPMYQGQAKLNIPMPLIPGLEMPISVSFANRSDLLQGKESKIRGRFGFTFDLARLITAFKNQIPTLPLPR